MFMLVLFPYFSVIVAADVEKCLSEKAFGTHHLLFTSYLMLLDRMGGIVSATAESVVITPTTLRGHCP